MMDKLRVIDLFAGIGGFSLGLHRTGGFITVKFCEMKPHAQAVLAKNFPGVPCHSDVTTYDFQPGEADVITAGFPCQDISLAGVGAGLAGARSGLYREVVRALRVARPAFAVLENVAALLGRGLGTVLGDLAEIGYDAEWHCIPASAVGAPHRRDRVWIIADARSEQHQGCRAPFSGSIAAQLLSAAADAHGELVRQPEVSEPWGSDTPLFGADGSEEPMADAERGNRPEMEQPVNGGPAVPWPADHAEHAGEPAGGGWWAVEPGLGRVADGVPNRVDRLEELGNAVVPQIPEIIGRAILERLAS